LADSGALRVRRARAHAAGDHSLCKRCSAVRDQAGRLAAAHEADPSNAPLARELRMTLAELMPKDSGNADADLTGLFSALQA
jgi:hypothetical protein